jgi:hypothetical protein
MREKDETDNSGTTAQFRAFVSQSEGPEATQPWTMRAPRNRVAVLSATVVGVAILLVLVAMLVIK